MSGGPGVQGLTRNAMAVLEHRYLRDGEGPDQMFRRVARAVAASEERYGASEARVEAIEHRFYRLMASLQFLPNSPTLMNAGRDRAQLAACFVVPVADSTDDIFDAVGWAAKIQKTGGGTGFSFSRIRPEGDAVLATGGKASGPVAFMQVFDAATHAIRQGGTRRGANMGILRIDHPDILEFIRLKLDPTRMRNFNLSVAITDDFMRSWAAGEQYSLIHPNTGHVVRTLDARRVLTLIANAAWTIGDPGLVFIDHINRANPTPALGDIEATNPCGEQPLLPFESCTLGSLNLSRFVVDGALDFDGLGSAVVDAVRFLDNVIDANHYPLPQIANATLATRKIGLGCMGFADLLVQLDLAYDEPAAERLACQVAGFIEERSRAASTALATARGPFPAFDKSRWAAAGHAPLRNATTTTIAPTGTISIIAGCSSGIEPLFALSYHRNVLDGEVLQEVNAGFQERAIRHGVWTDSLADKLRTVGRVRGQGFVPATLERLFPTAHDLSSDVHLAMQAAFQRSAHAGVSKTINMPHNSSPSDVERAYVRAYELGCKGITVYRDGSRGHQVLAIGTRQRAPEHSERCPECGVAAVGYGGCIVCDQCGWSACG